MFGMQKDKQGNSLNKTCVFHYGSPDRGFGKKNISITFENVFRPSRQWTHVQNSI